MSLSNLCFTTQAAPPPPRPSGWQRFLAFTGKVTLITVISGTGLLYYVAHKDRTPGPQLPHDPSKKTVIVLGSGWGATSLLSSIDTNDYNVVCVRYNKPLLQDFVIDACLQYVISPRNYFLFTPLLPSVAVGTLSARSILQCTRISCLTYMLT